MRNSRGNVLVSGILAVIVLIFIAIVVSFGSTERDEVGLHYTGGPFEGQSFVKMIPPGSGVKVLGLADSMITLPANQRTYIVAENGDKGDVAGGTLITANDSEGVAVQFATSSTFELDLSADKLNRFALDICTKYEDCYDKDGTADDGWAMMLNDYYRKAQESALQQVTQQYTVDQLMKEDRTVLQGKVAEATEQKLAASMGGKYFTDITFQIQRPIPPAVVQTKYNEQKAAELQTQVKAEEVKQAEQQARAAEELNAIENSDEYIALLDAEAKKQAVEKGQVQFWVLPEGQSINITK